MNNWTPQLLTGIFMLLTIWLKDFLDNNKSQKLTKKQSAIKAYALLASLPSSLCGKTVICNNLLKNKNFNYANFMEKFPDEMSQQLKELELLIIENFYDLKDSLFEYQKILNTWNMRLLMIITESLSVSPEEFQRDLHEYNTQIAKSGTSFQALLTEKYINKHPNIWDIIRNMSLFFSKLLQKK